jgi:hypothetical protein
VFALKAELEDLCFAVLHPLTFHALQSELKTLWCLNGDDAAARKTRVGGRRAAVRAAAGEASWVTLRARWVTLRARWVTLRDLLGDAERSLGNAESSLGDAKRSAG